MKSKKSRLQARLILHLPGDEKQPVRWSFRSPDGDEQGELAAGENDERLTHLFATYPAHILVPASEFVFHQVTLPPNAGRQRLQLDNGKTADHGSHDSGIRSRETGDPRAPDSQPRERSL